MPCQDGLLGNPASTKPCRRIPPLALCMCPGVIILPQRQGWQDTARGAGSPGQSLDSHRHPKLSPWVSLGMAQGLWSSLSMVLWPLLLPLVRFIYLFIWGSSHSAAQAALEPMVNTSERPECWGGRCPAAPVFT